MQVCKNKNSGKYFIYIQDTGNDEALLVTSGAEIKSLSAALFGETEDKEEDSLIANDLITDAQIQRFHQYEKDKSDNFIENFTYDFEQLSPYEQNRLREMLKNVPTKPNNK